MQNRKRDTDVQNRPVCILNHLPCLPLGKRSNGWSSAGVSSWTRQLAPGGSRPVLEWLLVEKCLICSTLSSWQHLLPPASPAGTSKPRCLLPFYILPFHPNPTSSLSALKKIVQSVDVGVILTLDLSHNSFNSRKLT